MIKRVAVAAGALLLVLVSVLSVNPANVTPRPAEASPASEPILLLPSVCGALLASTAPDVAGGAGVYAFACTTPLGTGSSSPETIQFPSGTNVQNIHLIAAGSQRNGENDVLPDRPPFPEDIFRCNDFPEADDVYELLCALDLRDGVIDGFFDIVPGDFAGINLDGNQMSTTGGQLIVIAPVNDQGPVQFDTNGGGLFQNASQTYICTAEDSDCDDENTLEDDGVVVAFLTAGGADPGEYAVEATQESITWPVNFLITGEPHEVEFVILEPAIQTGIALGSGADDCPLATDAAGFLDALAQPVKTTVLARVLDDDGVQITGRFVVWTTEQRRRANWATDLTPTLDLGTFGFGAPNILCGFTETGTVTVGIEALSPAREGEELTRAFNTSGKGSFAEATFEVFGPPAAITLEAAPPTLNCDGFASSTVTATITDADGNPVVSGNEVSFSVLVLGTANPLITESADGGTASSVVTPLISSDAGVPVTVSTHDLDASILISCVPSSAAPPPDAGGAPGTGTIRPPDTGSGGQAPGGLSWMVLAALTGAGAALATASRAIRNW
jgi:hypothetical protein